MKVWNTSSGFCFVTFSEHLSGITGVVFNQNGQVVLSSSLDGTVRAFDLNRYLLKFTVQAFDRNVISVVPAFTLCYLSHRLCKFVKELVSLIFGSTAGLIRFPNKQHHCCLWFLSCP